MRKTLYVMINVVYATDDDGVIHLDLDMLDLSQHIMGHLVG
jgi:hypothetical protein